MKPTILRTIICFSLLVLLSGCGPSKNSIAYKNNGLPEDQSSVLHYWHPDVRVKVIDGAPDDYKLYSKVYLTPGIHKIEGSIFGYRNIYDEIEKKTKTYQIRAKIDHNFMFETGKHYHITYDLEDSLDDVKIYLWEKKDK